MAETSMTGTSPGPTREAAGGSFAELMDRVVWDYSPRDEELSPLVSTARYFDEFPWDGETSQSAKSHNESPA